MGGVYNLCIIKPNKSAYSETFIQEQINRLQGDKKVLYGGAFPVYDDKGNFLISSKVKLLSYLFQKRILRQKSIGVREKALIDYFIKEKVEVVLAEYGMVGGMVTSACKKASVPLVVHFHGADAHHIKTINKYRKFYKMAFDYAEAIVVVSGDMQEALRRMGAPEKKIHLIPYGVDTGKFQPLGFRSAPPGFLSVGRFVPKKSPDSVIRAFKAVAETFPEARLWMAGQGPLWESSRKLVSELGISDRVIFPGVLSHIEIQELMACCRCFVQHSVTPPNGDMEGTPNAILEASAVGLPVVSTKHAGIKQAVIDGVSGFLVDEYDVTAMAGKMLKVARFSDEEVYTMGNAGRTHILKNYNIAQQIAKLDEVIRSAV